MKDSALVRIFGLEEDRQFSEKGPGVKISLGFCIFCFGSIIEVDCVFDEVLFGPLWSFDGIQWFGAVEIDNLERAVRDKTHNTKLL